MKRLLGARKAVGRGDLLITITAPGDAEAGGTVNSYFLWLKRPQNPSNSADEALSAALWEYLNWARSQDGLLSDADSSIGQPLAQFVTRAFESSESGAAEAEAPSDLPQSAQPSESRPHGHSFWLRYLAPYISKGIGYVRKKTLGFLDFVEAHGYMLANLLILATLIFGVFGAGLANSISWYK